MPPSVDQPSSSETACEALCSRRTRRESWRSSPLLRLRAGAAAPSDSASASASLSARSTSAKMNLSQAVTKGLGVLRSPKPYTVRPCSRMREARRVKSLSLETMQKPSKRPV